MEELPGRTPTSTGAWRGWQGARAPTRGRENCRSPDLYQGVSPQEEVRLLHAERFGARSGRGPTRTDCDKTGDIESKFSPGGTAYTRVVYDRDEADTPAGAAPLGESERPKGIQSLRQVPGPYQKVLVQYWLFYYYDDWIARGRSSASLRQSHEADWEVVTVGFDDREPLFVSFSSHCGGTWVPWRSGAGSRFDGTVPRRSDTTPSSGWRRAPRPTTTRWRRMCRPTGPAARSGPKCSMLAGFGFKAGIRTGADSGPGGSWISAPSGRTGR